ncbi:hypothetical protein GEMRC1_002665 [Eukaryota sp. GEM-RC1]
MTILGVGTGLFLALLVMTVSLVVVVFASISSSKGIKFLSLLLSSSFFLFLWFRTEYVDFQPSGDPLSDTRLYRLLFHIVFFIVFMVAAIAVFLNVCTQSTYSVGSSVATLPPYEPLKFPAAEDEDWEDVFEDDDVRQDSTAAVKKKS